jgi:hypothetical protein
MYTLMETEEGIIYKCQNCKHTEENHDSLVHKTQYKSNEFMEKLPSEYLIHDKTIPHTKKKVCPNEECPSRKDPSKQDAIFFNQKHTVVLTFVCTQCLTQWNYS